MSRLSKITKKISSAGKSAKDMVQGLGMCTIAAILIIVVIVIFVIVPLFRKKKQDNFYYEGFADPVAAATMQPTATTTTPRPVTPRPLRVARATPAPTEDPACEGIRKTYIDKNANIRRYRKSQPECAKTISDRDQAIADLKAKCNYNDAKLNDFYSKNPLNTECK